MMSYSEVEPGPIAVGIRRGPSEGGCFFDVYDFAVGGCQ
jgi:hypothetical protein